MTCEEAQKTISSNPSPKDLTRAERALLWRHVDSCIECRKFIVHLPVTPQNKAMPTTHGEITKMVQRDWQDPEYREVARPS